MNTNKKSQNILLNASCNRETNQDLLQIACRLARTGKKVLYIAAKAPESLPMDDDYDDALYRDILMNIVFSYSSNASQLINFFLDLRQHRPRPEVIIIDFLHTFFDDIFTLTDTDDCDSALQTHFMECHMLITAALHSAVDMFTHGSTNDFISIVCIDPQLHCLYKKFIQKYVDLYYYKEGSILSLEDLKRKISQ